MEAKGGVISFRADGTEVAFLQRVTRTMPRKANGHLPSLNDAARQIVREASQRQAEKATLEEVIRTMNPQWTGVAPAMPQPVKLNSGSRTPVSDYLERQR